MKESPAQVDVIVARPAVGPHVRVRLDLGFDPRPPFDSFTGGRLALLPLGLSR